jgi:hypothetical protein
MPAHQREVFTLPRLIHMESMWNPWSQCWLKPQPICCSMDIMDSMWNDQGMDMEWLIPYGFHRFHMEFGHVHLGFHGQVHMNSMEQGSISMGNSFVKNNVTI